MKPDLDAILEMLRSKANPRNVEGMARFGINPHNTLGVSIPTLREMAKGIGKDHDLAQELWDSQIHEARILACLIDDPKEVNGRQMERWVRDFDSWDVCDQCCSNLFDRTTHAHEKAMKWAGSDEEFVKRAGFVLMAALAVHDKKSDDAAFARFLPIIVKGSTDERNFVRKAVNWALRQIGKRNLALNRMAVETALSIQKIDSRSARWVASDALRELRSDDVISRLRKKAS